MSSQVFDLSNLRDATNSELIGIGFVALDWRNIIIIMIQEMRYLSQEGYLTNLLILV